MWRKSGLPSRHNKPARHSAERPPPHTSTVWSNIITQMKLRQTVHTRSEIVFGNFLNKCIQVQLKAFQLCQVLVE